MATWKDWFKMAKEKNFPLEKIFIVDQPKDLDRLHNSGLPFYDYMVINGAQLNKNLEKIKAFVEKNKQTWIRILGKNGRYYKLDLRSYEEIIDYINSLNINVADYQIQLFEFYENTFGGNVIVNEDDAYIEINEGNQEQVSRNFGNAKLYFGRINKNGRLVFFGETPINVKKIGARIMKLLKVERTKHLKGYFEFAVSPNGKICFLDYKLNIK